MIDSKDIEILLVLQRNPLAKLSQIANHISLSVSNTSARIEKLENEHKIIHNVQADLNLSALEFEIHDFFFNVESKEALKLLEEKFSFYHPYLLYRGRCNGKINGLYMQFRIPVGGLNYLEELASILQSKEIITDYEYIKRNLTENPVRVKSSLKSWDSNRKSWIFDWDKWRKGFAGISQKSQNKLIKSKSILNQITDLDIKLLSELTRDARRKNVEIMKNIRLDNESGIAQKVSRRLHFLKKYAISDYRMFLHWSKFDLYQSIIVKGQCNNGIAYKIKNYLLQGNQDKLSNETDRNYFPFQSSYFITDHGFFWYIRAPPSHLSQFIDFIWEVCPKHDLYFLDYMYSEIYGLWDQTFDVERKAWKLNYEFMIDNVLNEMFKK